MAQIIPFRAWRYAPGLSRNIDSLICPLFDVISQSQKDALYQLPYNSIHLSAPNQNQSLQATLELLKDWKKKGILVLEHLPAIYAYYQEFRMPGSDQVLIRKGFICLINLENQGVIRHEATIPDGVSERELLLEKTMLQTSPTHGLYYDSEFEIEKILDQAMQSVLYKIQDDQQILHTIALIQDADVIKKIQYLLIKKNIILADGHHRYQACKHLATKKTKMNPNHTGTEAYNYHLMYVSNAAGPDLKIWPTHRLVCQMPDLNLQLMVEKLDDFFNVERFESDAQNLQNKIKSNPYTFGLALKDNQNYVLSLRKGLEKSMDWKLPDAVMNLDLTVLHYYVYEKTLGIEGPKQAASNQIGFERNLDNCMELLQSGQAQAVFITQELDYEQVVKVSEAGALMPPKSTYFYPKALSGFVFGSLIENEFYSPINTYFAAN